MQVHVLQHVAFEGLGSMAAYWKKQNASVSYTHFWAEGVLPAPESVDFLIILGGPMSVNDEQALPWLVAEKTFVKACIELKKPVLGICLGAQLIASALGASVYKAAQKEIGCFPIKNKASEESLFQFQNNGIVFHWHGETFDLPAQAQLLASSQICENQAFQIFDHVMGLQFHLETTPESLAAIMQGCANELVPGDFIQTETQLKNSAAIYFSQINQQMESVLNYLQKK